MAERTVAIASSVANEPTAIDIGAGEGRDSVLFAEHGWKVYAVDTSQNGLEKAERLAERRAVDIETIRGDANELTLPTSVDVVYSAGAVQYIRPENRARQFDHFKSQTNASGVHAIFAFVDHPEIPTPPDWTENEYFYEPGELADHYEDWETIRHDEIVFDDSSGSEPHQHAAEILFAQNTTR
ncbi:methyltransferase domain-containing protein [Halogeometricum sp. S3BR5-2]|uniref:Methyltransferase domain-containing protein n=2 Tax=Halogeometricum luteum TaxID=2950537 RepID=A0ABU2FYX2_9EURY|nr:methyltransferase domain-containing protein [Halogeometricum sp. S3BR5-2]